VETNCKEERGEAGEGEVEEGLTVLAKRLNKPPTQNIYFAN